MIAGDDNGEEDSDPECVVAESDDDDEEGDPESSGPKVLEDGFALSDSVESNS